MKLFNKKCSQYNFDKWFYHFYGQAEMCGKERGELSLEENENSLHFYHFTYPDSVTEHSHLSRLVLSVAEHSHLSRLVLSVSEHSHLSRPEQWQCS